MAKFLYCWLVVPVILGVGLSSCTKIVEPRVDSLNLGQLTINGSGDVEALLVIKIHNPNDLEINVTIKDLRHYRNDELLGYLVREQVVTLEKNGFTTFSLPVVFKKEILMSSIFSILLNESVEIKIEGNIIAHHWSGDYDIALEKAFPINLKTFLGQ